MFRLLIVLALISTLAQFKPAISSQLVARPITGLESLQPQSGLVELKGTVLATKLQDLGGSVITLSTVDGQQPTLFIPPGVDIRLPQFGTYISVVGKLIAKGVISVEQIKLLRTPLVSYQAASSVEQGITNQRISIPVRSFELHQGLTKNKCFFVVFEESSGVKRTGLIAQTTEVPREVNMVNGYLLNSGIFFIESCS